MTGISLNKCRANDEEQVIDLLSGVGMVSVEAIPLRARVKNVNGMPE